MSNAISSITLCRVPISPTHQIDFSSKSEQFDYFRSNARHTFEKCKYQARSGTMRVKGYVDTLNDCNYGYYTNKYNGTTKTYYFWIVQKNFLARETTELTIQIDVFQTWLFDIHFKPCFIEREHTKTDYIGEHTLSEDFELGDYVVRKRQACASLQGKPAFFIGVTDDTLGGVFGRTYSGFAIKYYDYDHSDELSQYIRELCDDGKADAIAFIFTFPDKLVNKDIVSNGSVIAGWEGVTSSLEEYIWNDAPKDFYFLNESYFPYNNKLYSYPYSFLTIKNSSGSNVVLKFENFNNINEMKFKIDSVLTQNPTISLTPLNYCRKSFAIDDSITTKDYGLCSWNNDNYGNWFAQHQNSINAQSMNASASMKANAIVNSNNYENALSNRDTQMYKGVLNTAISTIQNLGNFNFLGAVASGVGGAGNTYLDYQQNTKNANNDLANASLMNTVNYQNTIRSITASVKDAQVQPNTCKGDTSSCGLDLARDTATFFIEHTTIKPEYARIIDMYFQMFGYQVNSVKKPEFKTRQKWNYIKTVNCNVYGTIPHEDMRAIDDIFNNGITIWHKEEYMFNYDTTNKVLSEV